MSGQGPPAKNYPVFLAQLVIANIVVAGTVAVTLYWVFTRLMAAYFERLMEEFEISPTKLNSMFATDVEQSVWWGLGVALAVGLALSLLLTKTLLRPISNMITATEKIAEGDFSARAPSLKGELGTLSWHLNNMAGALERQEEGRRQLLRDFSHELRTPLTNVKGYIEGLEDGVFQVGPEVFDVLNAEVGRLNGLIDDLSVLSLHEELTEGLQVEPSNVREEIVSVAAAHKASMVESNFELKIEEIGVSRPFVGDKKRLHQIFNNAVANMVRYSQPELSVESSEPSGLIVVDWSEPKRVKIYFENSAPPIPDHELSRLFDRFYRVDKSRARDANNFRANNIDTSNPDTSNLGTGNLGTGNLGAGNLGTGNLGTGNLGKSNAGANHVGLGLAIVRRLVSAHGGKVWVEQGKGRFRLVISLPQIDEKLI